jgi:hypothetical protein
MTPSAVVDNYFHSTVFSTYWHLIYCYASHLLLSFILVLCLSLQRDQNRNQVAPMNFAASAFLFLDSDYPLLVNCITQTHSTVR